MIRPRARRLLTDQDRAIWAAYVGRVAALPGRAVPEAPPVKLPDILPRAASPPPSLRPLAAALAVGAHPGGLDNASWNRFRTGRLATARTLDLHGKTAQRAYHALQAFLLAAHADHVRVVEIITGRGAGEAGGVLRRELPMWLNLPDLRPLVLAASHPHQANTGSVRLLLRRPRA